MNYYKYEKENWSAYDAIVSAALESARVVADAPKTCSFRVEIKSWGRE
jgi:hypothetical protein